jgi:endonuclease/exonuclease/phosphatase family metal-dependent hydrolase
MEGMRAGLVTGLVAAVGLLGCTGGEESIRPLDGDVAVTAMTYNIGQIRKLDEGNLENMAEQIADIAPDFVGVSECTPCEELIEILPARYEPVAPTRAGVNAIYDTSRWRLDAHGFISLGANDDGYGERVALWARLGHIETGGKLLVYATHWCVATRSPDDSCDVDRHLAYADQMVRHMSEREPADLPVVLTGDFNLGEQDTSDPVLGHLARSGLVDAVRALQPDGEVITWPGAPPEIPASRADFIFAPPPVEVLEAYVDQVTVPQGSGSDHFPVIATLRFR